MLPWNVERHNFTLFRGELGTVGDLLAGRCPPGDHAMVMGEATRLQVTRNIWVVGGSSKRLPYEPSAGHQGFRARRGTGTYSIGSMIGSSSSAKSS